MVNVPAQKPYQLLAGEEKTPVLSLECARKGKKEAHILIFSPGGAVAEDDPEAPKGSPVTFIMSINGTKYPTAWIAYGTPETYAYYGKTEPERVQFIESLLRYKMITLEFRPFLTGQPTTSVFDMSKLQEEMQKHPECSIE